MGGRIQQLIAVAAQARLMVLGSRSPGSLDRIWTGGTVTGVASRAACPVVVVPADGEPREPRGRHPGGVQVASARGRAVRRVVPSGRRARRRAGRAARLATRGRLRRHHRGPRGGGGVVPSADRADRTGAGGLPSCVPGRPGPALRPARGPGSRPGPWYARCRPAADRAPGARWTGPPPRPHRPSGSARGPLPGRGARAGAATPPAEHSAWWSSAPESSSRDDRCPPTGPWTLVARPSPRRCWCR